MHKNDPGVEYANILAEISIGKNLEDHYKSVSDRIEGLNRSIDNKRKLHEDCDWIVSVCHSYYRLQQLIRAEYLKKLSA